MSFKSNYYQRLSIAIVIGILFPFQLFPQLCGITNVPGTGARTWTAPSDITSSVTVEVWGGGGGGGGSLDGATRSAGNDGGGGGGGAYSKSVIAVVASSTYNISVGAGGTGGVGGGADGFLAGCGTMTGGTAVTALGTAGGDSWFWNATTVMAKGGNGGGYGSGSSTEGIGGSGGAAGSGFGTTKYSGGNGSNGDSGGGTDSGGGGSSAGTGANGNNGSTPAGGNAPAGGGDGGDGTQGGSIAGCGPGGGGGAGDENCNGGTRNNASDGGNGLVILRYTTASCPSGFTVNYGQPGQVVMTSNNAKTICSGSNVNLALTSSPASTYTWRASSNGNVTGETTGVTNSSTISNTLTNTTATIQTVTYTVTPANQNNSNCTVPGLPQVVNISVNPPSPTMTSANSATICSGGTVSIALTATVASSFSWIATDNDNTTGESIVAQGTSTLSNTITNNTAVSQTVTYTVTPTTNNGAACLGTSQVVSITVLPTPTISSANSATICSGTAVSIPLTANIASTFSWVATDNPNTTGESTAPQATSTLTNTLVIIPSATQTVTYTVSPTSNPDGCVGTNQVVNVTVDPNPGISLSSAAGTDAQSICVNTPIVDISYAITGSHTGASVTALPAGLIGAYGGGVFTISGTPTVSGVFDYTVTTTGSCTQASTFGSITVGLSLTSAAGTDAQEVCINTGITNITYAVGGATESASASGLPAGVSDAFVGGVLTISGIPTVTGEFTYTVTTVGLCAVETTTGFIRVGLGLNTAGNDTQSVCKNSPIVNIDYTVVGGGTPTVTGLPAGVSGALGGAIYTISGTPNVEGTFDYTVTTTGLCATQSSLFGQITVGAGLVAGAGTDTQTVCKNAAILPINYKIIGGVANVTGLPFGINGVMNGTNDTLVISGSSAVEGRYSYTLSTLGGTCDPNSSELFGELTIGAGLISAVGTDSQKVCKNASITSILYKINGGVANVSGLPVGVNAVLNGTNDTLTISGTPTIEGTYSYSVNTVGGTCDPNSSELFGELVVGGGLVSSGANDTQTVCKNGAIAPIQYHVVGAVAAASGLPAGIIGVMNGTNDTITISGSSSVEGIFNFTVSTVGGLCDPNASTFTGELTIGGGLVGGGGNDTQTVCKNAPITDIQYKIVGGVAGVSGLPTGVSAVMNGSNDTLTISGTPSVEGTFSYSVTTAGGTCDPDISNFFGELTVGAGLIGTLGTDTQTVCKNAPISNIVYKISGGVANVSGLPTGVTAAMNGSNDTLTISGTPTVEGTYSYTLSTLGGTCDPNFSELFGELTIGGGLISAAGTDTQTVCKSAAITPILYKIEGGAAIVTGLPTGINGTLNVTNDTLTISGSSATEGTFSYTVSTGGGLCGLNSSELYGELTIGAGLIGTPGTDTQTVCKNAPIVTITYKILGGVANVTGLPAGVVSSLNGTNDTLTISGTANIEGRFSYTVNTAGGTCDPNSSELYGEITVGAGLIGNAGTDTQTVCKNSPIIDIRYKILGGIANVSGLPTGVGSSMNGTNDTLTISGTPTAEGRYSYTVSTVGGACDPNSSELYGELTIGAGLVDAAGTDTQTVCKNTPINTITYKILGGVANVTGLPTGVNFGLNASNDTLTISGTPTTEGRYSYTVSTAGGTCDPNSSELYGELTIGAGLVGAAGTDTQTICKNAPINAITYKVIGGVASVSGLPTGVGYVLNLSNDTLTILGTPSVEGRYSYTLSTVGGTCDPNSSELFGELTVGAGLLGAGTDTQTVCKNTAITSINYKIIGGVANVTGLPTGLGASLNGTNDTLTISGTPTVEGRYSYTVSTLGGTCDPNSSELYGEITVGAGLVDAAGTDTQTVCKNSAIVTINYKIIGGVANVIGLPTGVNFALNASNDTLTISGTPSKEGRYSYTVSTAGGTCDPNSSELYGELTIGAGLVGAAGTDTQTVCKNTPINAIPYKFIGGVASVSGLPTGVGFVLNITNDTLTILGTPSVEGRYSYTLTTAGGTCDPISSELYGELTVGAGLLGAATDTQTVCKNAAITSINYKIIGGVANVTGLPPGVSDNLNATNDTLFISGIPTVAGRYSYTVNTAGGTCDPNSSELYGEITVGAGLVDAPGTDTQTVCKNAAITSINYKIIGGVASVTGLPTGVNFGLNVSNDTLTISGTPTIEGRFSYTVSTAGGTCDPNSSDLYGELTIGAGLVGAAGTDTQTVCKNAAITDITYKILGGIANVTGLPIGVSSSLNGTNDTLTISGTPTIEGRYSYTVSTAGGSCDPNSSELYGELTIGAGLPGATGTDTQAVCKSEAIIDIRYKIQGGVVNVAGLPTGIIATLNATNDTLTISGSSAIEGTYTYTVSTEGGTCDPDFSLLFGNITIGGGLVNAISAADIDSQSVCRNSPIIDIQYKIVGGVAQVYGLPTGINFSMNSTSDTLIISGTGTVAGVYPYLVTTAGGTCDPDSSVFTGSITINEATIDLSTNPRTNYQTICVNDPINQIQFLIGGTGTGATISSLPLGLDTLFSGGIYSISGTPQLGVGIYTYSVTPTGGICPRNTSEFTIEIVKPNAQFSFSPEYGDAPLQVEFFNISQGANNYMLDFGDGNSSTVVDTLHTYSNYGEYKVTLIASMDSQCRDTATSTIVVYNIRIPNVFSPNNDGINDVFRVNDAGVESIHVEIFTRWGIKVYEWNLKGGSWDGRNSRTNLECNPGTYFYVIHVVDIDGQRYEKNGFVTLLR